MAKKKAAKEKTSKKKTTKNKVMRKTRLHDDLLIELGTEELPPKALKRLRDALGEHFANGLKDAGLLTDKSVVRKFAAPRRLAVNVSAVLLRQPDQEIERRGPALQAAFDKDGNATRAAEGFARSCGTSVDKLGRVQTDKGEWLVSRQQQKGLTAKDLIPEILDQALKKLPIPKRMRWGDLNDEFVRPVHWLVMLHGDKVIPAEILAVKSGRKTRGHRFHAPSWISIAHARDYEKNLRTAFVLADYETRQQKIKKAAELLAIKHKGRAVIDSDLLDEVTSLVEWPEAIFADFDKEFLNVPAEALISTMQEHQKYFPVTNKSGKLQPHFITISNIKSKQKARVREGNERVIRARFSDAKFFWDTDRRQRLDDHVEKLKDVVFHVQLGSVYDKAVRTSRLAAVVARALGAAASTAERAGLLAKADLMTAMVYEFPNLQGVMGRYYAESDGEQPEVAIAMEEQYLPRFAGDKLPETTTGRALAIADKLDTLVGIFGIGEIPTGEKDPFALRRAALGVLRIMIECKLDLDLVALLEAAVAAHVDLLRPKETTAKVYEFMMDRLRAYYTDAGISIDVFEAVRARNPDKPYDFDKRVRAVMAFRKLEEADSLTTANKRIRNILKQGGDVDWDHVSEGLLQELAEKNLANKIKTLSKEIIPLFDRGDYTAAMKKLAALRPEVDDFFDNVMVMVDEEAVRDNRLALLSSLSQLFLRVADLSRLQD
ncbi:MAG: glycine--tRNA ligase subunit beta [Acidiferrobacterales bacterium]